MVTIRLTRRGARNQPFHPAMMVKVLVYGYATGVFSSRKIERRLHEDLAFRMLSAGNFPKHRTIRDFRALHLKELADLFVQVVKLAREMGLVKLGTIAVDGTKIKADSSRHKAMSYRRMPEEQAELEAHYQYAVGQSIGLAVAIDIEQRLDVAEVAADLRLGRSGRARPDRSAYQWCARHFEQVTDHQQPIGQCVTTGHAVDVEPGRANGVGCKGRQDRGRAIDRKLAGADPGARTEPACELAARGWRGGERDERSIGKYAAASHAAINAAYIASDRARPASGFGHRQIEVDGRGLFRCRHCECGARQADADEDC